MRNEDHYPIHTDQNEIQDVRKILYKKFIGEKKITRSPKITKTELIGMITKLLRMK